MPVYHYNVEGTGKNGATWRTSGEVQRARDDNNFNVMFDKILRETFTSLICESAEYGDQQPCAGPYTITSFLVERLEESAEAALLPAGAPITSGA